MQKFCTITGIICFIGAFVCLGVLGFYGDDLTKVYKASFAASAFFFFSVGFVLQVIGNTNLPSFSMKEKSE